MFNQEAIKAVAAKLNSRGYQAQLNALSALSNLLLRKRHGSNVMYATEFGALLHNKLEEAFPLPFMNVQVNGKNSTVTIDQHVFKLPEETESILLNYRHPASPFSVVIQDDTGAYHMIASGDRYAIPHGEYSVPFDYKAHALVGSVARTGNLTLNYGQAIWLIEDWTDFGKVLASNDYDLPAVNFQRTYDHSVSCSPLELDTEESLKTVHLSQDLTDALGLEKQPYPYSVDDLVVGLLDTTREVEDLRRRVPTNTDTERDKVVLDMALKIQDSIHFKDLLAEVMELPAKKRTKKALDQIIPRHLQRRIDEWSRSK